MIHYMLLLNVEVHFLDNISKGNANSSRTTHTLNIYGGTIDVRFVLSSKGTLVCNSSSSVLVFKRTSPSLLHTFVACTTQLSISIHHTGNSFLHQHIPRKRLWASSCLAVKFERSCLQAIKLRLRGNFELKVRANSSSMHKTLSFYNICFSIEQKNNGKL